VKTPVNAPDVPTPLVGVSGAAKILDCSETTVRQLARRGELAVLRADTGYRLFRRDLVEQLAAARAAAE
jgi:excisionase family DNA binding protein